MLKIATLFDLTAKGILAISLTALAVIEFPKTANSQPAPPSCSAILNKLSATIGDAEIASMFESKLPLAQLNLSDEQKVQIQQITEDEICNLTSGMSPPEIMEMLQSLQRGSDPSEALNGIEIEASVMANYVNEIQNILTAEQKETLSRLVPSF